MKESRVVIPCPQLLTCHNCGMIIGSVVMRTVEMERLGLILSDNRKVECPSCKFLLGHIQVKR